MKEEKEKIKEVEKKEENIEKKEENTEKKEENTEKICARCGKEGKNFPKCGRCKETYYCGKECQKLDWTKHKSDCLTPEERKKLVVPEDVIVQYVECATFEECRDWLQKHPELINKKISDEMFEKGFLTLKTHPPEIGTRFIRNAQILQYLLDLRKVSGGQQDITLFFSRILDPHNDEYRKNFVNEYQTLVKRILKKFKQKEKELKKKEKEQKQMENIEEQKVNGSTTS